MDVEQSGPPEIVLENTEPAWVRLVMMGGAVFFAVWAICKYIAKPDSSIVNVLAFIFGGALFGGAALFNSDLRWTVRSSEIQIDETWIYDRREVELVRSGEITAVRIDRIEDDSIYFHIRLCRAAGYDLKSPPIVDAGRARELQAEIAKRLNAPLEENRSS